MNPDLPEHSVSVDPALGRLFRTLTAEPAPGELAGEQDALAMFRAQYRPPTQVITVPPRRAPRWRLLLAGASFLAVVGGMAGAAYAAVLPAPVQDFAHRELGVLGVPPAHHARHVPSPAPRGHSSQPGGHAQTSPALGPSGSAPVSHQPSASPSPSAPGGADLLTAAAAASNITAGTTVTVDGMLTRSGSGVPGARVTLLERRALTSSWKVAGHATTDSAGNVSIQVSVLATNAAFRLTGPGRASSPIVRVTVSPPVTLDLRLGPRAIRDVLVVSTRYARPGNVVVLQVQSATGAWVDVKHTRLNVNGKARFVLDGQVLKNKLIRVKLRAAARHASSLSSPLTVPPPA